MTSNIKSKSPFTILNTGTEVYIYHRGKLMYKRWLSHRQPSLLFNKNKGWPNEFING